VTSSVALKEWAVVVEALATGSQLLLVRKGGIRDSRGEFQLQHREFLLYPTTEHQRPDLVRPEFQELFSHRCESHPLGEGSGNGGSQGPSVPFRIYGGVAYTAALRDPKKLAGLERYHIWTPDFFEERMRYRPQEPPLVILLRAYRFKKPILHSIAPEYAGCKSWVSLNQNIPLEGMEPVVENRRFRAILQEVSRRLG